MPVTSHKNVNTKIVIFIVILRSIEYNVTRFTMNMVVPLQWSHYLPDCTKRVIFFYLELKRDKGTNSALYNIH